MEHVSHASEIIWNIFGLLLIALAMLLVARRIRMPYTVLLVLVGILLAATSKLYPDTLHIFSQLEISPDLILYIFLPTLLFESSYNLDVRHLSRNLGPVLLLAVPGLLISTMLIGYVVWWATDMPLAVALLLGAILSATDPVAVVAMFRQMGAPERLTTMIEGESLFNDATSIVVAGILVGIAVSGTGSISLADGVLQFILLFFGGIVIGVILGYLASLVIGWVESEPFIEIGLTTALAYLSFLVAEDVFHVSGVMATVAAGLTLGSWGRIRISATVRIYLEHFWELLAFLANGLLFLLVGMKVDLPALGGAFGTLLWVAVAMLIARAAIVFGLMPLVGHLPGSRPVAMAHQFVVFWGGLRGAVALAIVLSLPPFEYSELLTVLVMGAVLFTLLVQGLSIEPLMKRLGLNLPPLSDRVALFELNILARQRAMQSLPLLQEGGVFSSRISRQLSLDCDRAISDAKEKILNLREEEMDRMHEVGLLYLRALGEEKAFYQEMFSKGHFSEGAFREMILVLNLQIDALRYHGEFEHVHSHRFRRMMEQYFYSLSKRAAWLTRLAEKMRMSRIVRNYEEVWGHYQGSAHVIQSLGRLAEMDTFPPEAIAEVRNKYMAWHELAGKQLYEVSEQFPEFVTAMQERLGQRLILLAELETAEEQEGHGMLSESAAKSMEAKLTKQLASLRGQPASQLHDDPISLLKAVPLFTELDDSQLDWLASIVQTVSLPENEVLVHRHETGQSLFLVARGVIRIDSESEDGTVRQGTLVAGEFFGEAALMGEGRASATVRTVMPCRLYAIHRHQLLALIKEHPELDKLLAERDQQLRREADILQQKKD